MTVAYLFYKGLTFECSARHVALLVARATRVYLKKYTPKSTTG